MLYPIARNILFKLPPEIAHHWTLNLLRTGLVRSKVDPKPCRVMGIDFPNPVGLAAGLDKNGDYIDALANLGFGFIEIGTVTPQPQPGNPKPRLFRLPGDQAIINRMGFNNKGVNYLVNRVQQSRYRGVLGINIGKNADTPVEEATSDYLIGLKKVYPHASYITVNISSPNTPGLRELQFGEQLNALLSRLKQEQARLADHYGRYVPLAIKIAPDQPDKGASEIAEALRENKVDAVIATNTTVSRANVDQWQPYASQYGGLSGAPLSLKANFIVSELHQTLNRDKTADAIPIIGVGGIMSGDDARAKFHAGASLVQLYTGLIYRGPRLVGEACQSRP